MSCFTFEFGTPDSHFYHIPEGSVSHVRILSRGVTGDIYFKWPGNDLCGVPRADCEALVEWMCMENKPIATLIHEPRAIAKPIGWEGTFGEAVKAMKEGWKVRREYWPPGHHILTVDDRIRTESGAAYTINETAAFATDWELVD